jgi:hypothetical protein
MSNRLSHLQSLQLDHDRRAEQEFWSLPKTVRFQRLGLRLSVLLPTVLRYEQLDAIARRDCLLRLTQLAFGCGNTLGIDVALRAFVVDEGVLSDGFGVMIASSIGNIADAGEKIDHVEEFRPLAEKGVSELISAIVARASADGVDVGSLVESAATAYLRDEPVGSRRIENFDTSLSPETIASLAAVDSNIRMAAETASTVFVGSNDL